MIIANRVASDCGFDYDDNAADVLWDGGDRSFAKMAKTELARELMNVVVERYHADARRRHTADLVDRLRKRLKDTECD